MYYVYIFPISRWFPASPFLFKLQDILAVKRKRNGLGVGDFRKKNINKSLRKMLIDKI